MREGQVEQGSPGQGQENESTQHEPLCRRRKAQAREDSKWRQEAQDSCAQA